MLTENILKALNDQIQAELYSSYVYLSMAAYLETTNMPGYAAWMRVQSSEEYAHAIRIFEFVLERDETVALQAIGQPPAEFGTPLEVAKQALEHERHVTSLIHDIYGQAKEVNDYGTQVMLEWFITEQIEEEKSATDIVQMFEMAGDHMPTLFLIDRDLAGRQPENEGE